MKNVLIASITAVMSSCAFAQTPQGIPYQAIAKNTSGTILANQIIRVRFSIHDSVANGIIVYQETSIPTTTAQGLFSVNIGSGTAVSGAFSSINWGHNFKFLQVEIDPSGGTSFVDMGTQQMMSVPYAIYAQTAGSVSNNTGYVHYRGEHYGGGIVFHVYKDNTGTEHGLIIGLRYLSSTAPPFPEWGCYGTSIGAAAQSEWNGAANTSAIVAACGISTAAGMCDTSTASGYTDWYLPSKAEYMLIYNNLFDIERGLSLVSGSEKVVTDGHWNNWTSTEMNGTANTAWIQSFDAGTQTTATKYFGNAVRAIRRF